MGRKTPRPPIPESQLPEVSRILIALDAGTGDCKATWRIIVRGASQKLRLGCDRGILQGVIVVQWPNNKLRIPSVIGYDRCCRTDEADKDLRYRQTWGQITTEAGRRAVGPKIRWLKAALYGDQGTQARHKRRIEAQIDELPEEIRFSAQDPEHPGGTRRLTCLDLYSDFLGHAWRHILRQIQQVHPNLPWPQWTAEDPAENYQLPTYPLVEVSIPLPASSKPHHIQLAVQAARRAGIPDPFPVAEPVAAFVYDMQSTTERDGPVVHKGRTLIVDIGCGSVDIILLSMLQVNPTGLREDVEGTDGWCGANRVNETLRAIVKKKCEVGNVWQRVSAGLGRIPPAPSLAQFLDEVEAKFEIQKIRFGDSDLDGLDIEVKGLPELVQAGMRHNQLCVSGQEVRDSFEASCVPIKHMIDTMIDRFKQSLSPSQETQTITEILLIGGGSASPYIRAEITKEYERGGSREGQYPIPVRKRAVDRSGAATWIAQGALLLLLDKAFLRERVIRRGYCIKIDEETTRRGFSHLNFEVQRDPHDGIWRRIDVSRFLIRIGERISSYHKATGPQGSWRGLFLHQMKPHGWDLEEEIFYSDTTSEDGLWVTSERNDIHPCGMLRFSLTEEDCSYFAEEQSPVTKRWYKYLEYRVDFVIQGLEMTYTVNIPRDGKLQGENQRGLGRNPIVKFGKLDCTGSFELFNSV